MMLFLAFRNPRGNRAVIVGVAIALALAAVVGLAGTYALGATPFFSELWLWLHSMVRLAVAAVLLWLMPRSVA